MTCDNRIDKNIFRGLIAVIFNCGLTNHNEKKTIVLGSLIKCDKNDIVFVIQF